MSFVPESGRCIICHVHVKKERGLVFRHEMNDCEHQGRTALTGTLQFMNSPAIKKMNDWIEFEYEEEVRENDTI
jgi:hypothetical protein